MNAKFNNGDRVRDHFTGFVGVVECTVHWINGCIRYGVRPEELREGKPIDLQYFDEEQLGLEAAGAILINQRRAGGDRADPSRPADPTRQ